MKNRYKILIMMAACSASMACSQNKAGGFATVAPSEFAKEIKADSTAYILDVRTPEEFAEGHIAGAHNLDWLNQDAFRAGASSLSRDRTLYVYCRSGRRSAQAASYLSSLGYKVVDLDGGYLAWGSLVDASE